MIKIIDLILKKSILKSNKNSDKPFLSEYYYLTQYYSQLIEVNGKNLIRFKDSKDEQNKVLIIADKICNIEIYPFPSSEPQLGKKQIGSMFVFQSDLSRLSAYIILRRIYRYLLMMKKEEAIARPVFVFRKYNRAWQKLFEEIFKEVEQDNRYFAHEALNILEKYLFLLSACDCRWWHNTK